MPKTFEGLPIDEYVQYVKKNDSNYADALIANFSELDIVKIGAVENLDFTKSRITVNTDFIKLYHNNDLDIYGEVQSICRDKVVFSNESEGQYDAIVFCTGFSMDLPAFADTNFNSPLIANVASPDIANLWLVGCPAVWGGSPPIAEAQARLIAFAIKHGIELDELKTIVANAPNYEQTSDTVALGFKVVEFKGYMNFVEYICSMQKYRRREWIIDSQSPYFGSYQIHLS